MKTLTMALGWALRASAAICMTWIVVAVFRGQISTVPALLGSVVWHAGFALAGVQLVGAAKRMSARTAPLAEA
jgi:hypothetical protein